MIGNLKEKLAGTRETIKEKFEELLRSDRSREEILEKLTESMIFADVGMHSTEKIIGYYICPGNNYRKNQFICKNKR